MRIAITGSANTGKTTLVSQFLQKWTQYETPEKTYRDVIKDNDLSHSTKASLNTQTTIFDYLINQTKDKTKTVDDNIIYDRCPLDALVYSIWCYEKGIEGFTSDYIQNQINECKESMRFLDIVFLCKFDDKRDVVDDGVRDTNVEYIKEIDNIFESIFQQYTSNIHADVFFPKDDSPGFIKLPNSDSARCSLIEEYVTPEGGMFGDEHSILNPDNIEVLETLVQKQQESLKLENEFSKDVIKPKRIDEW